jgi:hypothetical protein
LFVPDVAGVAEIKKEEEAVLAVQRAHRLSAQHKLTQLGALQSRTNKHNQIPTGAGRRREE